MTMKSSAKPMLKLADFLELTKPRVTFMVVLTAIAGFYMATQSAIDLLLLLNLVVGTALVAGGTSALNQLVEIEIDRRMKRTSKRPLPAGRLAPRAALLFGVSISTAGILYLLLLVNALTSLLAAATLISYVFIYTPMKRTSPMSTVVGAIPGALPPVGGWTAVRGELSIEAGILFAILFFWQLPHFLAIAWLYREDYARGGLRVLPVIDEDGDSTSRYILSNTLALLTISLMPTLIGISGHLYFWGAILLGAGFLLSGIRVSRQRTQKNARKLLLASVVYLPCLLLLMSLDKVWL